MTDRCRLCQSGGEKKLVVSWSGAVVSGGAVLYIATVSAQNDLARALEDLLVGSGDVLVLTKKPDKFVLEGFEICQKLPTQGSASASGLGRAFVFHPADPLLSGSVVGGPTGAEEWSTKAPPRTFAAT